ncbi:SETMR methyltransferase, partial [Acromyrmex insinuator]
MLHKNSGRGRNFNMEQRAVIKFNTKLDKSASETFRSMQQVYGSQCLGRTAVFEWHKRFLEGRETLEDDKKSGRPILVRILEMIEKVRDFVANDRNASLKMMEEALNISRETIPTILHEDLSKTKVCVKFVPHTLLSRILNLTINVNKLNPMRAGCHIKVPQEIATKRAVISVRTTDNACFAWSAIAVLYSAENYTDRESSYPHYTIMLNFAEIFLQSRSTHEKIIIIFCLTNKIMVIIIIFFFRCLHYFSMNEKLQSHVMDCQKINQKLQDTRLSFFSSLIGDTVFESDYAHAANVWQRFSIRTLGDCVASYGLDPAYYYTLPGSTWDAMLKHTRIKFELLTNIDMIIFIERGGLSQYSSRYAQTNNKYIHSYLMYYDVNNLYGWAMCQPLPYDAANFDVSVIALDSSISYILDLEYPQHLHDQHTDLSFCPTRNKPPGKRKAKLLATLYHKQRYVIHYIIIQFAQSPWLRGCIEFNTNFRTHAKNDFAKNLYKLMNNAIFDKIMENVRNHIDVKLIIKWDGRYGAETMIAKPNFHSRSVFAENLIALEVKFNKSIYVGMCILDISKVCLYEFHHEYMLPLFRDKYSTSDYPIDNAYGMPLAKKVPGLFEEIEMTHHPSCIRSKLHKMSESKIALSPYDDK